MSNRWTYTCVVSFKPNSQTKLLYNSPAEKFLICEACFESSIGSQEVSFLEGSTAGGFLSLSCLTSLTSPFFILSYLFYLALLNLTFPYLASSYLSLPYLHRAAWRGWRPLCPRLAPWRRQKENSLMEDTNKTEIDKCLPLLWYLPSASLIFTHVMWFNDLACTLCKVQTLSPETSSGGQSQSLSTARAVGDNSRWWQGRLPDDNKDEKVGLGLESNSRCPHVYSMFSQRCY